MKKVLIIISIIVLGLFYIKYKADEAISDNGIGCTQVEEEEQEEEKTNEYIDESDFLYKTNDSDYSFKLYYTTKNIMIDEQLL